LIEVQKYGGGNILLLIMYHEDKVESGKASRLYSNIGFVSYKDAAEQFNSLNKISNHNLGKWFLHSHINLAKGENLTDQEFKDLSADYLSTLGYNHSPFIIYRHHDKVDQEHIHFIVSRNKFDGGIVLDSFSKMKANKLLSKYEKKYNFVPTSTKARVGGKLTISQDYQRPDKSQQGKYQNYDYTKSIDFLPSLEIDKKYKKRIKHQLKHQVQYAFINFSDIYDATNYLKRKGISVTLNHNSGGIYGISFSPDPSLTKRGIAYKKIPNYHKGVKLSPTQISELKLNKKTTFINKSKNVFEIYLNKSNRIEDRISRDQTIQWNDAIEKNISFKGSQLHKTLSWSSIKAQYKLDLPVGDQILLSERLNVSAPFKILSKENQKLLTAYENNDYDGILESIQENANPDILKSFGHKLSDKLYQASIKAYEKQKRILSFKGHSYDRDRLMIKRIKTIFENLENETNAPLIINLFSKPVIFNNLSGILLTDKEISKIKSERISSDDPIQFHEITRDNNRHVIYSNQWGEIKAKEKLIHEQKIKKMVEKAYRSNKQKFSSQQFLQSIMTLYFMYNKNPNTFIKFLKEKTSF